MPVEAQPTTQLRLAELVAALSLGIDLGFGQPMEHVLRQCLIALRLAEGAGLDEQQRAVVYYAALLVNVGCHSDAHEQAKWFGDDIAVKAIKYDYEQRSLRMAASSLRFLGAGHPPGPRGQVAGAAAPRRGAQRAGAARPVPARSIEGADRGGGGEPGGARAGANRREPDDACHSTTANRRRPISWPELVITSTLHRPAGSAGKFVLCEKVRKPSWRPPWTGESSTLSTTAPSRRQTCTIAWLRLRGA